MNEGVVVRGYTREGYKLTAEPGLMGLDGAEVVVSVSGEDGGCNGRFEGVWGAGIFVLDVRTVLCLEEGNTGLDVGAGTSEQVPSSCEPVSQVETKFRGAGISNGFGTEYRDL